MGKLFIVFIVVCALFILAWRVYVEFSPETLSPVEKAKQEEMQRIRDSR